MLSRIRWFVLGAASMFGVLAYLSGQVRRAREQLTPETMARTGARSVAGILGAAAGRIQPTAAEDVEGSKPAPRSG
jgi:hypothetical protein